MPLKKPAAGWKRIRLSIASMITAPMALSARNWIPFIAELGWQALLNTRGTTWRKLDESLRNSIDNADAAAALMLEMPAIIKRPLLCAPGRPMLLGFSEASYQQFNEV
ncbi:TPA: ArsC/Spx/MgsR family protein [Klebsiella pneumoniae]